MLTDQTIATDVFKGLPRRIQIGPNTFRVIVGTPESNPDLEENNGMTYMQKFQIHLLEGMPAQLAAEIVQHEVSHCINNVYGVDDDSSEEHSVTQHSKGLTELWLRNPRLLNWMVKTIRNVRKEAARD
jgi:hypothetical protein